MPTFSRNRWQRQVGREAPNAPTGHDRQCRNELSTRLDIEAGEWLARLDRSDLDDHRLAEFERWCATSPAHAEAYARLAATWLRLDGLRALGAAGPVDTGIRARVNLSPLTDPPHEEAEA